MKKIAVEVTIVYARQKIDSERIGKALDPYLRWDGQGTFLGGRVLMSDVEYVGKITPPRIAKVHAVLREIRKWPGIKTATLRRISAAERAEVAREYRAVMKAQALGAR